MDVCLHEISKYIKLAGKKQDKCIIKVCEKIMNDVKGPLDGQKDIEDSLSDKNKPNEDGQKLGLNRKVKKLKRSWYYLKKLRHTWTIL